MAAINLFGFELSRAKPSQTIQAPVTTPVSDDGAITTNFSGGFFGSYLDLENNYKNENDLITRYREMAMQPELESAIDDIVNESVIHDDGGKSVDIILDDLNQPDNIKQMIIAEFKEVLRLLNFSNNGQDVFKRWYVDGRLFYQVLVDQKNPKLGIQQLVYLDPRKTKKVRQIIKSKDPRTNAEVVTGTQEFYVYNDKSEQGTTVSTSPVDAAIKLSTDAVININSGLMDPKRNIVLSYLHKAIKPLNMLRMVEDAIVIYRISRAPERRVFYVDVGNLPKIKADQYLNDVMNKFRNKVVYDSATGTVKDDRKFMSMLEDYWIPRRGEGKSTEVTTLPSGQNLGELSDVKYFQNKLYNSLNVPISRLESATGFTLGRSTEITRDELKFTKFVERLRAKFSVLFDELMKRQLALKGICSVEEWDIIKETIHFNFLKDNNFTELKEAELLQSRIGILTMIDPFIGIFYSKKWVSKNILQLNEEDQKIMEEEMYEEAKNAPVTPASEPTAAKSPFQ